MRKLAAILLLTMLAGTCLSADFNMWWPWIYKRLKLAITNAVSPDGSITIVNSNNVLYLSYTNTAGSNAWAWVQANSNGIEYAFSWTNQYARWSNATDWVEANSNAVTNATALIEETYKSIGIWGIQGTQIVTLVAALRPAAGLWMLNDIGEIVVSNQYNDEIWTTNALGHVVPRDVP